MEELPKEIPWKGGILAGPKAVIVYEPLGEWKYAYWVKTQIGDNEPEVKRGIAEVQEIWEESDEKKRKKEPPKYIIDFAGASLHFPARESRFFKKPLPFRIPTEGFLKKWIAGEVKSRSSEKLWRAGEAYVRIMLDLEDEFEAKILALSEFQTWLQNILDWVFNVDVGGPFGSGKTAMLEGLGEVCYHAIIGNPSAAAVARMNERFSASWFIDEYDKVKLAEEGLIDTFVRQGYRRGIDILRHNTETGETEAFNPFGPKFLSYHTKLEDAVGQRSIVHIKMEKSQDSRLPIINFVRQALSQPLFDNFFIWYMDNIASLHSQGVQSVQGSGGGLGGITIRQVLGEAVAREAQKQGNQADVFQVFLLGEEPDNITVTEGGSDTPLKSGQSGQSGSDVRQRIFEIVTSNLSEDERALLADLKGRGAELGFSAILIARALKIDIVKELREALTIKALEEEEPEFNATEIIRELISDWHYRDHKEEITKAELFTAARQQAKEWGQEITPTRFGMALRDLGFREGKNVKRKGKRRIRTLVIDKRAKKHIPPPEKEETLDKESGPTLKFRDFSFLFRLLEDRGDDNE